MATSKTYMSYEETVPLIRASIFKNFTIYQQETIEEMIDALPDSPYGEMPPGVDSAKQIPSTKGQEHPLSNKEKGSQNKYAQALCMRDNRKASGIALFVKNILKKEVDCSKQDPENRNCAYGSVLTQVSNHDYSFNQATGEEYSDEDFRRQTIFHMTEKAEDVYKLVNLHLDVPYKVWLRQQLSPMEDGDMVSLIGMRHLLQVSKLFPIPLKCNEMSRIRL